MRKLIATIAMLITTATLFAATWTSKKLNDGQTKFIFRETFLGRVYIADAETKKEIPLTVEEKINISTDISNMITTLFNCEEWVKNNSALTIENLQKDAHLNLRLAKQNLKEVMENQ